MCQFKVLALHFYIYIIVNNIGSENLVWGNSFSPFANN